MRRRSLNRPPGSGWLVLLGGGEFSFGETLELDRAWLERTPPGPVGFVPAASGSSDYGRHFGDYLAQSFERTVQVIPIYRLRDARRKKNLERIAASSAIYLGAGIADQLLDAVAGTPAAESLLESLRGGATVVAMGAAAQTLGQVCRSLRGDQVLPALGWLSGGVVEANFTPAHDRRLRELLARPEVSWGLGVPAGSAVALGPEGRVETVGPVFRLDEADGDLEVLARPLAAPAGGQDDG